MRKIGTAVTLEGRHKRDRRRRFRQRRGLPCPRCRRNVTPPAFQCGSIRECDVELPRAAFCSDGFPDAGPRAIVRALSAHERAKVEARATALEDALKPFTRTRRARRPRRPSTACSAATVRCGN